MVFQTDGDKIMSDVSSDARVAALSDTPATRRGAAFGIRNVLSRSTLVRNAARSGRMTDFFVPVLGDAFRAVRGIFFNQTNWPLPWHQDRRVITVARQAKAPGYRNWMVKQGCPHLGPPAEVLRQMVALRLPVDPGTAENRALQVMPGRTETLPSDRTHVAFQDGAAAVTCATDLPVPLTWAEAA